MRPKIVRPGRPKSCAHKVPSGAIEGGGAEEAGLAQQIREAMGDAPMELQPPPIPDRPRRLPWPDLLARVFAADVLHCDKCGGHRTVSAFIPGGRLAREVLDHLGIKEMAPPIAKARAPPHQEEAFDLPPDDPGVDEQYAEAP